MKSAFGVERMSKAFWDDERKRNAAIVGGVGAAGIGAATIPTPVRVPDNGTRVKVRHGQAKTKKLRRIAVGEGGRVGNDIRTARLAQNIRDKGFDKKNPVLVLQTKNGQQIITGGHHRIRAAEMLGMKKVPTKVIRTDAKHPTGGAPLLFRNKFRRGVVSARQSNPRMSPDKIKELADKKISRAGQLYNEFKTSSEDSMNLLLRKHPKAVAAGAAGLGVGMGAAAYAKDRVSKASNSEAAALPDSPKYQGSSSPDKWMDAAYEIDMDELFDGQRNTKQIVSSFQQPKGLDSSYLDIKRRDLKHPRYKPNRPVPNLTDWKKFKAGDASYTHRWRDNETAPFDNRYIKTIKGRSTRSSNLKEAESLSDRSAFGVVKKSMYVVAGPPGGGKSTYARNNSGPDDVIVDLDEMVASGMSRGDAKRKRVQMIEAEIARPSKNKFTVIDTEPSNRTIKRRYSNADKIMIDPGKSVAMRRSAPPNRPVGHSIGAAKWYKNHRERLVSQGFKVQ